MILQSMNKGKQLFIAFYYWRDSNLFQKCIIPLRFFGSTKQFYCNMTVKRLTEKVVATQLKLNQQSN